MTTKFSSPIGDLFITSGNKGIRKVATSSNRKISIHRDRLHIACHTQLREYFLAKRKAFDLPLQLEGTAFQQKVWAAIRKIGYGNTSTFGKLAYSLGSIKKSRILGQIVRQNPLLIIIPSHRILLKNGDYSKIPVELIVQRHLLDLEAGQLKLFK